MALTEWYVNDAGSGTSDGTSEANAMSFTTFTDYMVTGGAKTAAPGDRFNIKGAITSRTTTNDVWVNGGTATSPVIVRGYNSIIGDLTSLARTNGNGPLVTTNYPTITYTTGTLQVTGSFIILESLKVTAASTSGALRFLTGSDCVVTRCSITNNGTNANSISLRADGVRLVVFDNDVVFGGASGGACALDIQNQNQIIANRITGGVTAGLRSANNNISIVAFNTIYVSTGIGITATGTTNNTTYLFNTIVGGGTDGFNQITATTRMQVLIGNMITDNTGDGIDMVSTANPAFVANLRTRDNATSINNGGDWISATNYNVVTTDTGGPETDYVNSASNDYRLVSTSPAVGAGVPLYSSIGALQRIQGGGLRLAGHGGLAS